MRGGGGRLAAMSAVYVLLLGLVVAVGSLVPFGPASSGAQAFDPVPVGPRPNGGIDFGVDPADFDHPCDGDTVELPVMVAQALVDWGNDFACVQVRGDVARLAAIRLSGEVAIDAWTDIAAAAEGTRVWPVLLGSTKAARNQLEAADRLVDQTGDDTASVLRAAEDIDVDDWFEQRRVDILAGRDYPLSHERVQPAGGFDWLTPHETSSGDWLPEVVLVVVPADDSAAAVAALHWGCWNDDPCPAEHVAILRDWHERYGADVLAMTEDILELRVTRPVGDPDAAVELAKRQYLYDYDIVDHGTGSIEGLASLLLEAPGWQFWWD
jgi:uncharacterized protein DUF4253